MTDIAWPEDLAPWRVAFYLQAHVGGPESPLTRVIKRYGLSRPRWVARFTFRGGYDGDEWSGAKGFGPRLDALVADAEGLGRFLLWDFRRPAPIRPQILAGTDSLTLAADAVMGATQISVAGFAAWSRAFSTGDYVGGDGRCHIVTATATADADGVAVIAFKPPLETALAAGAAIAASRVTSRFVLADDTLDNAGANETEVGGLSEHVLSFVEDLN